MERKIGEWKKIIKKKKSNKTQTGSKETNISVLRYTHFLRLCQNETAQAESVSHKFYTTLQPYIE